MQTLLQRLTSRKFLVSVIAGLLVTFGENFGLALDPEQIAGLVGIVAAFVTGETAIDRKRLEALGNAELLKANTYISSLVKKLESIQAEQADA